MRTKILALSMVGAAAALVGCGNYLNVEWNGLVGISHDGRDNLVLHVNTCENATSQVEVHAGREGLETHEPNPVIGSFSRAEPVSGNFAIEAADPAPWTVEQELALPEDPGHFFIATAQPEDSGGQGILWAQKYFSSASSTWEDLMEVAPGEIVTGNSSAGVSIETPESFAAACTRQPQ